MIIDLEDIIWGQCIDIKQIDGTSGNGTGGWCAGLLKESLQLYIIQI